MLPVRLRIRWGINAHGVTAQAICLWLIPYTLRLELMATDGPTPPPCDPRVFRDGTTVFIGHTIGSCAMEAWVKKIAATSGQSVDWAWMGGRAVVRALGDLAKVDAALAQHMPEYVNLRAKACAKLAASPTAVGLAS